MFNSFLSGCALMSCCTACFLFIGLTGILPASAENTVRAVRDADCRVDYYFTPGCDQCRNIEEKYLPRLRDVFGARVTLFKHSLFDGQEYLKMLELRARMPFHGDENFFFIVDQEIYIGGKKAVERDLIAIVEERLDAASKRRAGVRESEVLPDTVETPDIGFTGAMALESGYYSSFTWLTVGVAGLIDGLNPCAFAALVFLITLALAGGARGRSVILIGAGFCCGVYVTYYFIGLGLFQAFRMSFARQWLGDILRWLLMAGLLIMAFLSFRDARLYGITGEQEKMALKLPDRISGLVRSFIHAHLSRHYLFAGSIVLGFGVTVLESVCTGQLYVPTIAFLAGIGQLKLHALLLLALYDFMFIIPLLAVFLLAYSGVNRLRLVALSRKNVFWVKCAMGCFFVLLAVIFYFK